MLHKYNSHKDYKNEITGVYCKTQLIIMLNYKRGLRQF